MDHPTMPVEVLIEIRRYWKECEKPLPEDAELFGEQEIGDTILDVIERQTEDVEKALLLMAVRDLQKQVKALEEEKEWFRKQLEKKDSVCSW